MKCWTLWRFWLNFSISLTGEIISFILLNLLSTNKKMSLFNRIFSIWYPKTLLLFYFYEGNVLLGDMSFIVSFIICSTLHFSGIGTNFCYQTSFWYHSLMLHIIHFYQQDSVCVLCTRNVLHCLCWVVYFLATGF